MFQRRNKKVNFQNSDINVEHSEHANVAGNDLFSQNITNHIENITITHADSEDLKRTLSDVLEWVKEYRAQSECIKLENFALREQNKNLRKCLYIFLEDLGELDE